MAGTTTASAPAAPSRAWGVLIVAGFGIAFALMHFNRAIDPQTVAPEQHFYIVSVASVICVALALVAVRAALRSRDAAVLLAAHGFIGMSWMFAIHGLSTPGYVVDARYWVVTGFTARMAIVIGIVCFALSTVRWSDPIRAFLLRTRHVGLGVTLTLLALFTVLALRFPMSVPPRIMSERLFLDGTLVVVLLLGVVTMLRYYDWFRDSGLAAHGSMALGSALILEAQIAMHFGALWHWSWWTYHVHLVVAFLVMLLYPLTAGHQALAKSPPEEIDERLAA